MSSEDCDPDSSCMDSFSAGCSSIASYSCGVIALPQEELRFFCSPGNCSYLQTMEEDQN